MAGMMRTAIRSNLKQVIKYHDEIHKKALPLATAKSLTFTAKDAQAHLKKRVTRIFDRPTRFTKNAFYIKPAKPDRLFAIVGIKDELEAPKGTAAIKYLHPQIYGGPRGHKRFEKALQHKGILPRNKYAIPTRDAPLNRYGNVPGSVIGQMLSDLGAQRDSAQNSTSNSRSRRGGRGYRYFVVRKGGKPVGIFRRRGKSRKAQGVFVFGSQPNYRRRFMFHHIVETYKRKHFPEIFNRVFQKEMEKLRKRLGSF